MPSVTKQTYVSQLFDKLSENPHVVLVGFGGTSHKRLEEFRTKLREVAAEANTDAPEFVVLKNSLFKVAFDRFNSKNKVISKEEGEKFEGLVDGQLALMLVKEDWLSFLKVIKDFSKEEESFMFRAGVIDGEMYEEAGLKKLADLPGRDELIVKIITSMKAPQSRLVYGLQFNTMKLVNILRNAGEK